LGFYETRSVKTQTSAVDEDTCKVRIDNCQARGNEVLDCSDVASVWRKWKVNVPVFWDRRYISTAGRAATHVEQNIKDCTVERFAGACSW
jgi:hypothetical protein